MRFLVPIALALSACAFAAPILSDDSNDGEMTALDEYFSLVSRQVAQTKRASSSFGGCDMSKAEMATAPVALEAPSKGLTLKHVAIGRGVQNYTCDRSNLTAVPAPIGAVADLFNASCVAASYPEILATIPRSALEFKSSPKINQTVSKQLAPMALAVSGHHFFIDKTTPYFNLDTADRLGQIPCSKKSATPAPTDASKGANNAGNGAVPWLKLVAKTGATGNLQEVYRINTAGGNPPATCAGVKTAEFSVEYAAEYWFYSK